MAKKVILYSTPSCPYCVMAKEFLEENKVKFEYIDVNENQQAAEEMVEKSVQMSLPVIDVDGTIIIGFDRNALKKALGL